MKSRVGVIIWMIYDLRFCFFFSFFYLIGIDNIIKHHKEKKDGLPCTLTDFVRGHPLPDTLRYQGQTNLLHMAVAERK